MCPAPRTLSFSLLTLFPQRLGLPHWCLRRVQLRCRPQPWTRHCWHQSPKFLGSDASEACNTKEASCAGWGCWPAKTSCWPLTVPGPLGCGTHPPAQWSAPPRCPQDRSGSSSAGQLLHRSRRALCFSSEGNRAHPPLSFSSPLPIPGSIPGMSSWSVQDCCSAWSAKSHGDATAKISPAGTTDNLDPVQVSEGPSPVLS
mmetsp:Transcript_18553/g.44343  ORF Transcript_18553/g.44343 Transcript_18553/m.44343 type:complete len:200 (-) Transcript_18553:913-1512(-)